MAWQLKDGSADYYFYTDTDESACSQIAKTCCTDVYGPCDITWLQPPSMLPSGASVSIADKSYCPK
jgi:hypothetical protein